MTTHGRGSCLGCHLPSSSSFMSKIYNDAHPTPLSLSLPRPYRISFCNGTTMTSQLAQSTQWLFGGRSQTPVDTRSREEGDVVVVVVVGWHQLQPPPNEWIERGGTIYDVAALVDEEEEMQLLLLSMLSESVCTWLRLLEEMYCCCRCQP